MGLIHLESRNDALSANGPHFGDEQLSTGGSSWLWAVTAIFLLSFLALAALSFRPHAGERIFHYLFAITMLVGTIAYYAQACGLPYDVIEQANQRENGFTRQIYWAKYVFWLLAFPVVSLSLGLISGVSWATMFFNVVLIWTWIISFLIAAYTPSNYKWGFFVLGLLAYGFAAFNTSWGGHRGASRLGIGKHHMFLSGYTHFFWFLYVLGWALTDGGNVIGVTGTFIWFGILDIFLVPAVAVGFLFLSRKWDYGAMNLHFTQYGRVRTGSSLTEKAAAGTAAGAAAGTAAGVGHHNGHHSGHHTGTAAPATTTATAGPTNGQPTTAGAATGTAPGTAPAAGTVPAQQAV